MFEEGVGAVSVPEVAILPRLTLGNLAVLDGCAVDEYFDGPDVAGEVAGVVVGLGQRGRGPPALALWSSSYD